MARLDPWERRPTEEANLFNPAFLCALVYEFLKEFTKTNTNVAPITITVIALSTSLHRASRERLPHSTISPLYSWLQVNEDLLIDFATRSKNISPYAKEAILFGVASKAIQLGEGHCLFPGTAKANFPKSFLDETTAETKAIVDRIKFLARWFSKSGSEISILAAWGVKP